MKGRGHFDPAGAVPLSAGAWEVPSRRVANHTPSLVLEWVLVAGGSVAAWLSWTLVPARAEGLVTTLAHGWTSLCVALAALALLPHRDLRLANGSWRVWEVLLLLLRGAAFSTIALLVLPSYGDLWNRDHGVALLLGSILLLGVAQSWNLLVRPWEWFLASRVVRGPHDEAVDIVARVSTVPRFRLVPTAEEEPTTLGERIAPPWRGRAPDWLLLAVERRTDRAAQRVLADPGPDTIEAHALATVLELGALGGMHPDDLQDALGNVVLRTAASMGVALHSASVQPSDGAASASWALLEDRATSLVRLLALASHGAALPDEPVVSARDLLGRVVHVKHLTAAPELLTRVLQLGNGPRDDALVEDLEGLAAVLAAVRLRDERMLSWAVASAGIVVREDLCSGGRSGPLWTLASLVEVLTRRELMEHLPEPGRLPGAEQERDPERLRIETETRLQEEDLEVLDANKDRQRGPARLRRESKVPTAPMGRALLLRRERRVHTWIGPHGYPTRSAVGLAALAVLVAGISGFLILGSGPAIPVTDPFRPAAIGLRGRTVHASTLDLETSQLVLSTDLGVHTIDTATFRQRIEPAGLGGPLATPTQLEPLPHGGVLAVLGGEGTGLQYRSPDGRWDTWIAPADRTLEGTEIRDLAVLATGETLFLTDRGLLFYDEGLRLLGRAEVIGEPVRNPVHLLQIEGDFLVAEADRFLRLQVLPGPRFRSTVLEFPAGLGALADVRADQEMLTVRTDRGALLTASLGEEGRSLSWRILAGGRQFEADADTELLHVVVEPDSGSLAVVVRTQDQDQVRIRSGDSRFWCVHPMGRGLRVDDKIAPVLMERGEALLVTLESGALQLVERTAGDPLRAEMRAVPLEGEVEFLARSGGNALAILSTPAGRELHVARSVADIDSRRTRKRLIRPLEFSGRVVSAFPSLADPRYMRLVTSRGEVVEYDLAERSAVGDARRLVLPPASADSVDRGDWLVSCSPSAEGLLVTAADGTCYRFPSDPSVASAGSGGFDIEPSGIVRSAPRRRESSRIVQILDTKDGFEALSDDGEAWEYDLASGWQHVSEDVGPLDLTSLKRLWGGALLALTRDREVVWRAPSGWANVTRAGAADAVPVVLEERLPSPEGLSGFDAQGALIRIGVDRPGQPPRAVTLARRPQEEVLQLPVHDVHLGAEGRDVWFAHAGGIARYELVSGRWSAAGLTEEVVRLEFAGSRSYFETSGRVLCALDPKTLEVTVLLEATRSWAVRPNGEVVAVDDAHEVLRALGSVELGRRASQEGLAHGTSLDVTTVGGRLAVLEQDRILLGRPGERFTEARPLPCEEPRTLVGMGERLLLHGDGTVLVGDAGAGGWRRTSLKGITQLQHLEGETLAIEEGGRVWRWSESSDRFRQLLPGPRPERAATVASVDSVLERDGGLWLRTSTGAVRWEPDGPGTHVEGLPGRRLRGLPMGVVAWDEAGVHRLRGSTDASASFLHAGSLSHVFAADDGLGLVDTHGIRIRGGSMERTRALGDAEVAGDRVVDLVPLEGARFALLTDQGDLQVYEPEARRLERQMQLPSEVGDGRLLVHPSGAVVVQAEDGTLIGARRAPNGSRLGIAPGAASSHSVGEARGLSVLSERVLGLDPEGRLRPFDPRTGWGTIGPPRPRAPVEPVVDRILLDGALVLLREDGELHVRTGPGQPTTRLPGSAMQDPTDLIPLGGGMALVRGREDRQGVADHRLLARRRGVLTLEDLPRGRLLGTNEAALIVAEDNRTVWGVDGERRWSAPAGTVPSHEPVDVLNLPGEERALVLARDGRVFAYDGSSTGAALRMDLSRPVGDGRLLFDGKGDPVVRTEAGELYFGDSTLTSAGAADEEKFEQGERGVHWIDGASNLRLDRAKIALTELYGFPAAGRFPLELRGLEVLRAQGRTWVRGGGLAYELLAGGSWEAFPLPVTVLGEGADRRSATRALHGPDRALIATSVDGTIVSMVPQGTVATLQLEGLVGFAGGERPLVVLENHGRTLHELRPSSQGLTATPVLLDPSATPFVGERVLELAAGGPWAALDESGHVHTRTASSGWRMVGEPFPGADGIPLPGPPESRSVVSTRSTPSGKLLEVRLTELDGRTLSLFDSRALTLEGVQNRIRWRMALPDETETEGDLLISLEELTNPRAMASPSGVDEELAQRIVWIQEALRFPMGTLRYVNASGLIEASVPLEGAGTAWIDGLSIVQGKAQYLGKSATIRRRLEGLSSASEWAAAPLTRGSLEAKANDVWFQIGDWPLRVSKDGILESYRPLRLEAGPSGNLRCVLASMDSLELGDRKWIAPADEGPFQISGKSVEIKAEGGWTPYYTEGEREFVLDTPAKGADRVTWSSSTGAVIVNSNGRAIRFLDGGARRVLLETGWTGRVESVGTTLDLAEQPEVVLRAPSRAWTVDRAGVERSPTSRPSFARPDSSLQDLTLHGLEWSARDPWPRYEGRTVRLAGGVFEHEVPLALGDRSGEPAVEVLVADEWFTRGVDPGTGRFTGGLRPGRLDPWTRLGNARHPGGTVVHDPVTAGLTLILDEPGLGSPTEAFDLATGTFPIDRVEQAERVGAGWVYVTVDGRLVADDDDLASPVVVDASPIEELRSAGDGRLHVRRPDGTVLSLEPRTRALTAIDREESLFGPPGLDEGYPGDLVGAARLAAALASTADLVVEGAGEWIPELGCFAFEVYAPSEEGLPATQPDAGALRVPTRGGSMTSGSGIAARPLPPGEWRPAPALVLGDGFSAERRLFTGARGVEGAPSIQWSRSPNESKVKVPWSLADGLLPVDAVEGLVVTPEGVLVAFTRLGPRTWSDGPGELLEVLPAERELQALRNIGTLDQWHADYRDAAFVTTLDGAVPAEGRRLPGVPGRATSTFVQEVAGANVRLRATHAVDQGRDAIVLHALMEDVERLLELGPLGFEEDGLVGLAAVEPRTGLFRTSGTLVRRPFDLGCVHASLVGVLPEGAELEVRHDEEDREGLQLSGGGGPRRRVTEAGLREPGLPGLEDPLRLRTSPGEVAARRFSLREADDRSCELAWAQDVGASPRLLREVNGIFAHDQVQSVVSLPSQQGPELLALASGDQVALRARASGRLLDVSEVGTGCSRLAEAEDGFLYARTSEVWRPIVIEGGSIRDRGRSPLPGLPAPVRSLRVGLETNDWRVELGKEVELVDLAAAGTEGTRMISGWLPGDEILAFDAVSSEQSSSELLIAATGIRRRSDRREEILTRPITESWTVADLRTRASFGWGSGQQFTLTGTATPAEASWGEDAEGIRITVSAESRRDSGAAGPYLGSITVQRKGVSEIVDLAASSLLEPLPADVVTGLGSRPEGIVVLMPCELAHVARSAAGQTPRLEERGPVGLDTRIVGSSVLTRLSDPKGQDAWVDTASGLMSFSFDPGSRIYGVNHGMEPPDDLAKVRARSDRWELRETPDMVQFRDALSGLVSPADGAIQDGRLLQDEVVAIGTGDGGVWLETMKTLERGDSEVPGAWSRNPLPADYVRQDQPTEWALRMEPGDRDIPLGDAAILSARDGAKIRVADREVIDVTPEDYVLRPKGRGLWVVRNKGGSAWPVQWIKPASRWHR